MKVIDLTHTIKENMPVFPGTEPPKLAPASTFETDGFRETLLTYNVFSYWNTYGCSCSCKRRRHYFR